MNEDRLFQLLGAIIETNQAVLKQNEELLKQNREFIDFIEKRDADVSAIHALALKRDRRVDEETTIQYASIETMYGSFANLIHEKTALDLMKHKRDLLYAQENMELAEEIEAKQIEKKRQQVLEKKT